MKDTLVPVEISKRAASLIHLISSYDILSTLSSWISAVDLYHLALTNRAHFIYILDSPKIFKVLIRQSTCDGRGLTKRQAYQRPYGNPSAGLSSINPGFIGDEEIEIRVYNVKCDEAGALPCLRCGINVCEECRYYPRAKPPNGYPFRRPHLTSSHELQNIMCLCPPCDASVEDAIAGIFLNELCDCDVYVRWICLRCEEGEWRDSLKYLDEHTKMEWDWNEDENDDETGDWPSKIMQDHQHYRAFWCTCGAKLDHDTRPRCTWCKRRHLPEKDWGREHKEIGSKLPFFDNNPDYPRWVNDANRKYPKPYPKLGYHRPGDDAPST